MQIVNYAERVLAMNVRYFDTSIILSLLFSDDNANRALELWQGDFARASSSLLRLECWVNFHKHVARVPKEMSNEWRKTGTKWLEGIFPQFYFYEIDETVSSEVAANSLYGKCRTLDAIHLASASILAREADQFSIATFDIRMQQTAEELRLIVVS